MTHDPASPRDSAGQGTRQEGLALGEPYARRDPIADWTGAWRKAVRWQEALIVQRYTFKSSRLLSCGPRVGLQPRHTTSGTPVDALRDCPAGFASKRTLPALGLYSSSFTNTTGLMMADGSRKSGFAHQLW